LLGSAGAPASPWGGVSHRGEKLFLPAIADERTGEARAAFDQGLRPIAVSAKRRNSFSAVATAEAGPANFMMI
jgi:hypothetical protein